MIVLSLLLAGIDAFTILTPSWGVVFKVDMVWLEGEKRALLFIDLPPILSTYSQSL